MSQRLPDHLDPWRYVNLAKRTNGSYSLGDLPRLRGCLAEQQGEARFDLEFSRDKQHRACLHGTVEAQLVLECQRCLGTILFPVKSKVSLAFVESLEEAENLPDDLDPELVENGQVELRNLIEDELLLALPQVPTHPVGECASGMGEKPNEKPVAVRESPFAVLAQLKRHDE
ncbi:MAG: YceD family protein [Pseudomonadota bacterium]